MADNVTLPTTQAQWRAALDALPSTPEKIPSFFFAHGSPAMTMTPAQLKGRLPEWASSEGPLAKFLKDFGPALLRKYTPRAIVVFSAHWETTGERLVTEYGDENPLLYDYYGFSPEMYRLKFKSRGDAEISERLVQLYKEAGHAARTTSKEEAKGRDGRGGFQGPGFDHGVFLPFRIMFGDELKGTPVVQVSLDSSLQPEDNWKLGKMISALREEGILVLSGGLPIHNLYDKSSFSPQSAKAIYKDFHQAILDAVTVPEAEARKVALFALTKHAGFREANPREEHFIPLYVAAGAGETGDVRVLNALYGIPTVAFGV